jgi:galactokinase
MPEVAGLDSSRLLDRSVLLSGFEAAFGCAPDALASAPGRLEVLGNHTDYNEGRVLSCAVGQRTWAAVSLTEDGRVEAWSDRLPEQPRSFAVEEAGVAAASGDWSNYLRGVCSALQERGVAVPGFRLAVASELPLGAGMSSSAALEVSVVLALGAALGRSWSAEEVARIGQAAEERVVGARTGLLDQMSSLRGRAGMLLHTDFRTMETEMLALPAGLCFVVADSGIQHDLAEEYNERRASCEEAARRLAALVPGVTSLRDVHARLLEEHRGSLPELPWFRARHVVGEDARVEAAVGRLLAGDAAGFGTLLEQSHDSSRENFENSCPELDALVEVAQADPRCLGARLSGGGFGGITLHLVAEADAASYAADLARRVVGALGREPWTAVCRPGDGARVEPPAAP